MKKSLLRSRNFFVLVVSLILLTVIGKYGNAQSIGIGTDTPAPTSVLDLTSTNKGFLLPRLTMAQRDSIVNPEHALMIFNLTNNSYEYYSKTDNSWVPFKTGGVIVSPDTSGPSNHGPGSFIFVYTSTNAYAIYYPTLGPSPITVATGLGGGGNVRGAVAKNMAVAFSASSLWGFSMKGSTIGNNKWVTLDDVPFINNSNAGIYVTNDKILVYNDKLLSIFYFPLSSVDGFAKWAVTGFSGTILKITDVEEELLVVTATTGNYAFSLYSNGWTKLPFSGNFIDALPAR